MVLSRKKRHGFSTVVYNQQIPVDYSFNHLLTSNGDKGFIGRAISSVDSVTGEIPTVNQKFVGNPHRVYDIVLTPANSTCLESIGKYQNFRQLWLGFRGKVDGN